MWNYNEISEYVKGNMSEKRWRHVKGVVETAEMLAIMHNVDVNDTKLAALIHDVVKEQDLEVARQILTDQNEDVYLANSHKIWHAPLGALVAHDKFGITNKEILNAIKFHTTGRAGMSDLEKVLFVADYTEPNRKYEGCIAVRELWNDLDVAIVEILKQKITKNSASATMHPDTTSAIEFYKEIVDNRK